MPALPARASPPDSGRFERHRLTTRVRPQNFQNLYDPNSAYDFNSARFLVLSENQPKTAIHQIVACSKGTMAAIFTTALAKKPAFLRRQFRKKYDRKKVRNNWNIFLGSQCQSKRKRLKSVTQPNYLRLAPEASVLQAVALWAASLDS